MSYHVVLELEPEETKAVKMAAVELDIPAKELVKRAVIVYLASRHIESKEGK